jgi:hypothetical protein
MKPNGACSCEGIWPEANCRHEIMKVNFSTNENERFSTESIAEDIERTFVDDIKTGELTCYNIPDELLYKYPAPYVEVIEINGTILNTESSDETTSYSFEYDAETEQYWIYTLDLCQDFEDFPYDYSERGNFANLVEMLGGEYTCDDWKATWTIGEHVWEAKLEVDEMSEYKDFEIEKDRENLELSDNNDLYGRTVSGRPFTLEDMEKMLNVEIVVDQISMTACINE